MKGIHCALQGRLGQDAELRRFGERQGLGAPVRGRRRARCDHLDVGFGLREEGQSARGARKGDELYTERPPIGSGRAAVLARFSWFW
jgi:hypothetical protein